MIELISNFRSSPRAPRLLCTEPARICWLRGGLIEVVMVKARPGPRGLSLYDEVGSCIWPAEALVDAHQEFHMAFERLMQRQLNH